MGIAQPVGIGPTQLRRSAATRLSSGHVVMLLAGALGVLLTLSVMRAADHTRPVLVAARDLAPGTLIGADDVRVARVHVDDTVFATLYPADRLGDVRGQVATSAIRRGEMLSPSRVQKSGDRAAARVMSVSIARSRAVDGRLQAGDRVDVLAVDHDHARAAYVLTGAEVVSVDVQGGGALSGTSDDVTVSLVVDGRTAPLLAAAIDAGTVVMVRSTGAAPIEAG